MRTGWRAVNQLALVRSLIAQAGRCFILIIFVWSDKEIESIVLGQATTTQFHPQGILLLSGSHSPALPLRMVVGKCYVGGLSSSAVCRLRVYTLALQFEEVADLHITRGQLSSQGWKRLKLSMTLPGRQTVFSWPTAKNL